ncbi:hypothetical protein ACU686_25530 [Yinghuangia aomiensis]
MTNTELNKAWELLDEGDAARGHAAPEVHRGTHPGGGSGARGRQGRGARRLRRPGGGGGRAGRRAGRRPAVFDFGYACIEHGASYAAIPALVERPARARLACRATHRAGRRLRGRAAARRRRCRAPGRRASRCPTGPERYLLAYHSPLGRHPRSGPRRLRPRLAEPRRQVAVGGDRLRRMLDRADTTRGVRPLDHQDLRGWQFVLTGAVLAEISPHGLRPGHDRPVCLPPGQPRIAGAGWTVLARPRRHGDAPTTVSLLDEAVRNITGPRGVEVLDARAAAASFDLCPTRWSSRTASTTSTRATSAALRGTRSSGRCSTSTRKPAGPIRPVSPRTRSIGCARPARHRGRSS